MKREIYYSLSEKFKNSKICSCFQWMAFFALILSTNILVAETDLNRSPSIAVFTPPKGWQMADKEVLSPHVKILVIGPKLQNDMPPTMNLMIEPFQGDLKSYLKNVKKINDAHGDAWKDLGTLKTKAGDASLSQVDIRSKWGGEKLMHAIIVKNGYAYVLTATAAKSEFGRFYQLFYNALRSLQIYNSAKDVVKDADQLQKLENSYVTISNHFMQALQSEGKLPSGVSETLAKEQLFGSENFQNHDWLPFKNMLKRDYADLGEEWQNAVLEELKDQLFAKEALKN